MKQSMHTYTEKNMNHDKHINLKIIIIAVMSMPGNIIEYLFEEICFIGYTSAVVTAMD